MNGALELRESLQSFKILVFHKLNFGAQGSNNTLQTLSDF
jgi:hypothetical protein